MSIHYQLKIETGQTLTFDIHDHRSADLVEMSRSSDIPDWVRLEHHQGSICPYDSKDTKYCPAAFELQDLIAQCSDQISYEKVEFSRISDDGNLITQADMQTALFAVIAEKVFSSACKILNTRHWSMDYYSLIMTPENVFYRSLSSYLVRQFLLSSSGRKADFQLNDYESFVDEAVNIFGSLLERLRRVSSKDANNNAIVRLVMIAQLLRISQDKWIDDLKHKAGIYI